MPGRRPRSAFSYDNPHSQGHCGGCRKKRNLHKGLCLPCRVPRPIRQLVEAGVVWGTGVAVAGLIKKCKTPKDAQRVLELVHPIVMENIVVGKDMVLKLRSKNAHWVRRNGWHKGKNDQWRI